MSKDYDFLKESANLGSTKKLNFDDLGSFVHERLKVERKLEDNLKTDLKIDYSKFENHCFFNSAESKFKIAKSRILDDYPFNGSREEFENYVLSGSGYENYILEQWPRSVGYIGLNGTTQYVSSSDNNNTLLLGTSSLYVSAWLGVPKISNQNIVVQVLSASSGPVRKHGYDFYLSGATDPHIKFSLYSGSSTTSVSAAYAAYTASWNNVAAIYDQSAGFLSLYINNSKQVSASLSYNSIEWKPIKPFIGSGSQYSGSYSNYDYYSGSLDEVRIVHTASELYHRKNYYRPISSENFVKLYYTFNEGITGTSSVDLNIIDYSKSGLHGVAVNYGSSVRVSASTMPEDLGDPILYSFHSGVISFTSSIELSASDYDKNNRNFIYNLIPESVLKEDEKQDQLLKLFALAMARYFDDLKSYVDQFENLRTTNYEGFNETPDLFLTTVSKYFGWNATQHFDTNNPLEFFFGEGNSLTGSLTTTPQEIRNQLWKRLLNNMPYFLKSKGKRHSVDALFNVLGINKNLIGLKEYGFVKDKTSIEDIRIHKEKDVYLLGIGTGSLSASFIKVPLLITSSNSEYTVETLLQLPYVSASYSASINELTGAIWQFVDPNLVTGSFGLFWIRNSLTSPSGTFILSGTNVSGSASGGVFSSSYVPVFDGRFLHIAAGLSSSQRPFIELRSIENDSIVFSSSNVGATALSGVFTGSKYDFVIGGNSGSFLTARTHGFFGETRFWTRTLSGSEIDDHALNFESVGIRDPLERPNPLKLRLGLNENKTTTAVGVLNGLTDLSAHGLFATGSQFANSHNPYKKFLLDQNYLSPTVDLRWSENKIRVRNKSELKLSEIAKDTNEVALEFNLIDALNEDISKIFSSFEILNNVIGEPINKYRDEYSDLESYRRVYFEKLHREINFTNFFKLFKWFDKKIGIAIKQLLPVRTKFIGGEFVVESHFLERNKYGYKYPIFRTPKDIAEGVISSGSNIVSFCGSYENYLEANRATKGTYVSSKFEEENRRTSNAGLFAPHIEPKDKSVYEEGFIPKEFNTTYSDGDEKIDRVQDAFFRRKLFGDEYGSRNRIGKTLNPNVGINYKNEFERRELGRLESLNFDGYSAGFKTGSFIHSKIGVNANVFNDIRSTNDNQHYFGGHKKNIALRWNFLSGNSATNATSIERDFVLTGANGLALSASLYDANNVLLVRGDQRAGFEYEPNWFASVFGASVSGSSFKFLNTKIYFLISSSNKVFDFNDFDILSRRIGSPGIWDSLKPYGVLKDSDKEKYRQFIIDYVDQSITSDYNPLIANSPVFVLSASSVGNAYVFKNIRMDFDIQLTNEGVQFFKKIDNTNTEKIFSYINQNVMPGIG